MGAPDPHRRGRAIALLILGMSLPATLPGGWAQAETLPPPPANHAPEAPSRLARLHELGQQAGLELTTETSRDGTGNATLVIDTATAFESNRDRLRADYSRFLARVGVMLQRQPGSRVAVTGFGGPSRPGANPVLLGRRLRAIQVTLVENGASMGQVAARVQSPDAYAGPDALAGRARSGQVILLDFTWG